MQFQRCAIVILDHAELHSDYTAKPVHSYILNGKRELAVKCTSRSGIDWTEAKRSLSVIFCAHSAPVTAIAALYRPHYACPTLPSWGAGVPPPCKVSSVHPREGEMKHEQSSPTSSSVQQDTRAALLPAEGGACLSVSGRLLCWSSLVHRRAEGSREHLLYLSVPFCTAISTVKVPQG